MDEKTFQIPEEIKQALLAHPFHKVAGAIYGVDFEDSHAVFKALGEKLAMAMLERQSINGGLEALAELQKEALTLPDLALMLGLPAVTGGMYGAFTAPEGERLQRGLGGAVGGALGGMAGGLSGSAIGALGAGGNAATTMGGYIGGSAIGARADAHAAGKKDKKSDKKDKKSDKKDKKPESKR